MGQLNLQDTEVLRRAFTMLDAVLREGYDPKDDAHSIKKAQLMKARDDLKVVWTMKGKYPS